MGTKDCNKAFTGEINSRTINVFVEEEYRVKNIYLVFETPSGIVYETQMLNDMIDENGNITYTLEKELLKECGVLKIQQIASSENYVKKFPPMFYYVLESVGDGYTGGNDMPLYERQIERIDNTQNFVDVLQSYSQLMAYPTTNIKNNDKILVLKDTSNNGYDTIYIANVQNELFISWNVYARMDTYLLQSKAPNTLYGVNDVGEQQSFTFSYDTFGETIPYRDINGQIKVPNTPTDNNHAVSKIYITNNYLSATYINTNFVKKNDTEYIVIKNQANNTYQAFFELLNYGIRNLGER